MSRRNVRWRDLAAHDESGMEAVLQAACEGLGLVLALVAALVIFAVV